VCAYGKGDDSAVRLRSYRHPNAKINAKFNKIKIWDAARATSAAPFYFPTAVIAGQKFWDGGLANNNPVQEVWAEAESLFPDKLINCFVSLGTGFSERKPRKSLLPVLGKGKKILKSVTNTQRVHYQVLERTTAKGISYFRFNISTAQDEIGLADYHLQSTLEGYTNTYLADEDIRAAIQECAKLLARSRL
jgi:predicted acylesterase/phospholipase RssA